MNQRSSRLSRSAIPSHTILPNPETLHLFYVAAAAHVITIVASTAASEARCPLCGNSSSRVHSRYMRSLADLPWQQILVTLRLHVRRYFCDDSSCEKAIFAEHLPGVVAHYARRTERLEGLFTYVSFNLGGETGARLLGELGVTVSGTLCWGHIRSLHLEDPA